MGTNRNKRVKFITKLVDDLNIKYKEKYFGKAALLDNRIVILCGFYYYEESDEFGYCWYTTDLLKSIYKDKSDDWKTMFVELDENNFSEFLVELDKSIDTLNLILKDIDFYNNQRININNVTKELVKD